MGTLFIRYCIGYVRFFVSDCENGAGEILHLLHDIPLYDIIQRENGLAFFCRQKDAEKARKRLERGGVAYSSRSFGALSHIKRILRRRGLAVGLLLSLFLHGCLLNHVFSIRVTGNESISTEEVLETLSALGFYEGCSLSDVDIDRLYLRYLVAEKRAAWMHINRNGVTARVEIAEAVSSPPLLPDKKSVCNLVARCDGIVRRADVYSGGIEVRTGESVTKGQLLVSSFFETRVSGTLLRRARGTVWADTEPVFEMRIPKSKAVREKSVSVTHKSLLFLTNRIALRRAALPADTFRRIRTVTMPRLFSCLTLPFSIENETFYAAERHESRRDISEARALYGEKLAAFRKKYEQSGEILFEETSEREEDDAYYFTTRFLCRENIAVERNVRIPNG